MRVVVTSSGSAPRPEVSRLSALFALDGMGEGIFIRVNGVTTCLNIYDIRLSDTHPACGMNWPPDLTYVKSYLQRDDIRKVFHASGSSESWSECRQAVWDNLHMDKSPPSVRLLPGLLEKIPIMLFNGDQDLVCNYLGAERMIEALEWNGATGFTVRDDIRLRLPPLIAEVLFCPYDDRIRRNLNHGNLTVQRLGNGAPRGI